MRKVREVFSDGSAGLFHRLHALHFRDSLLEAAGDPRLQGGGARRAADAGPVKPHSHDVFRGHLDELHVAAIRLHGGAHEVNHGRDPLRKQGRSRRITLFGNGLRTHE